MLDRGVLTLSLVMLPVLVALMVFAQHIGIKSAEQHRIEQATLSVDQNIAVAKVKKPTVNLQHLRCLADNIYHEAGSEPFMGQVAVARVVMNRVAHGFASSPCKVIYQHTVVKDPNDDEITRKICQFSWVCEGKTTPSRNARYRQAEEIAHKVLTEDAWRDAIPRNVLFFHNTSVDPKWRYREVLTIGNHVFYSKSKQ